jgi:hypothetical protein
MPQFTFCIASMSVAACWLVNDSTVLRVQSPGRRQRQLSEVIFGRGGAEKKGSLDNCSIADKGSKDHDGMAQDAILREGLLVPISFDPFSCPACMSIQSGHAASVVTHSYSGHDRE